MARHSWQFIKFDSNYADEFDLSGFIVMTGIEWELHKQAAQKRFTEEGAIEKYFGTNEALIFEGFDEYLRCFKVKEISEEEYQLLLKLFPHYSGKPQLGSVEMLDVEYEDTPDEPEED
jgi:hypothetical protein